VATAAPAEAARPVAAAPAAVPPPPAPRFGREATLPGQQASAGGSSKGLMFGGIAAVLAVLGVGGYFLLGRNKAEAPAPAAAQPVPEPVAVPAAPAGPTQEEIQAQMAALVEERLKSSEAALRKQYDEQLKGLQRQLDDASKRPAPAAPAPVTPPAAASAALPTQPPASSTAIPAPSVPSSPTTAATNPAVPAPAAANPAPITTVPDPEPVVPTPVAPAPVRLGDLVSMGAGVQPPKVLNSVQPRYPQIARQTGRTATVQVRVLVDENGRATDTQLAGTRVGLGFDEAALDAARRTTFQAATKNGVRVKMWTNLNIRFTP
jgi:periplasmic protein TonB